MTLLSDTLSRLDWQERSDRRFRVTAARMASCRASCASAPWFIARCQARLDLTAMERECNVDLEQGASSPILPVVEPPEDRGHPDNAADGDHKQDRDGD